MKHKRAKYIFPTLAILFSFLLNSCYEEYINIFTEFTPGVYNQSKTEIAFYHFLSAGKPPKGISRFPDGGTHDLLFKEVTLYRYNLETGNLNRVFQFGSLPSNAGFWREKISWKENSIAFSITPNSSWEWIIGQATNAHFIPFHEKYSGVFIHIIDQKSTHRISKEGFEPALSPDEKQVVYILSDSSSVELWKQDLSSGSDQLLSKLILPDEYSPTPFWETDNVVFLISGKQYSTFNFETFSVSESDEAPSFDRHEIKQGEISDITKSIPFKDWGIDLQSVWPRKKKDYVQDIIRLNGNLNYRKAIIEEIGNDLDIGEIEKIIDKMSKYQNSLEGIEKMNYEIFSVETKDLLLELLEGK